MNWKTQAVIDAAKAMIPLQTPLRRLKRTLFPYATDRLNDRGLLGDGIRQVEALRALGIDLAGKQIVEIGSGWYPILPLVFRMAGAGSVTMVDQERLLDAETLRYAAAYIADNFAEIAALLHAGPFGPPLEGFLTKSTSDDMLAAAGLVYLAPSDFRRLPNASADVIVSRAVLEHVPEALLHDIAAQSRRVLTSGGIICHMIDMSDHWQHRDKSISRVNFLRHEDRIWRWTCINPQNFQNRLRRFEYISAFQNAGFEILTATGAPDELAIEALKSFKICRRYAAVPRDELAILGTTIIARLR